MIRRARWLFLIAAALVFGLPAVVALWARSAPPLPRTPVPQLTVLADKSVPLHAELVSTGKRTDLVPLSARISGRVAKGPEPGSIRHQWPGLYAEARFRGQAVTIRFDDGMNRFRVIMDGGQGGIIEASRPGSADLRISGLVSGSHEIRLEKMSESPAPALFGGFFVDVDGETSPPPDGPSRLVEFIGDSDTAGYGSTAQRRDCTGEQVFAATDSSQTFGPRVAAHFGMDYRMIARSGIGLVRNYGGGGRGQTMPDIYARALPDETGSTPMPEPAPGIIVVGLGSNDFGSDLQPDEPWRDHQALRQDFQPALIEFLRARRRPNPGALLVLLAFGEYGEELVGAYRAAEETLRRDGANVALVVLPGLERRGCHWHPSPRDHAMITDKLITAIAAIEPDWLK